MSDSDVSKMQEKPSPSMWHFVKTTLAAAVGVQSQKNLETDFSQKSIVPFIIAGVVFTAIFLLSLIAIVSLVVR